MMLAINVSIAPAADNHSTASSNADPESLGRALLAEDGSALLAEDGSALRSE